MTPPSERRAPALAFVMACGAALMMMGSLVIGCGASPTPHETVERFFQRFNDSMPDVLAEERARILAERVELMARENVARQDGDEEAASEAQAALEQVQARLRYVESLSPRMLELRYRLGEPVELEWPAGAVQIRAEIEGRTLQASEQRFELVPISQEHGRWVFTLQKNRDGKWIVVDQRLASMRPYEEELRAHLGSARY